MIKPNADCTESHPNTGMGIAASRPDDLGLLKSSLEEIERLRRANEILGAKVEVFDSLMCVLYTRPAEPDRAMAVDVAWQLRNLITEMESHLTRPNTSTERAGI